MAARALRVRELTGAEVEAVRRLAHSRTEPARLVERARMVRLAAGGRTVPLIARELGVGADTVRTWLKRFNAEGLDGLRDRPRSGRPATYTPEQVSEVVAASLIRPDALGLPFASWTLDRLRAYLHEAKGIPMKRTRIDEILLAEGLRWRKHETWFGERVDPAFAEKRGGSRPSTRHRRRAA